MVDTNVPVTANGRAPQASDACRLACIRELKDIRERRRVLLDAHGLILDEYRRHLSFAGEPGVGDAFFKWLWDNQANTSSCERVAITRRTGDATNFNEFPQDSALSGFDRNDRKFVAVVVASGSPGLVINAVDRDWADFEAALRIHGVHVRHLCPELMSG